jgi:starvation-inducible DNA-binding protein
MNTNSNNVGLQLDAIQPVIKQLGQLLADYQVFYTNLRGLHWNIQGDKFFELHEVYENYFTDINEKIDATAERIVMLGGTPDNRFSDYLKTSKVKEIPAVSDWKVGTANVLQTLQCLLDTLRTLHQLAVKAGDAGTVHFANHDILCLEKKVWMISVYMKD